MAIRDTKLLPSSNVAPHLVPISLDSGVAISLTERVVGQVAPRFEFLLLGAQVFARVVAGSVILKAFVLNAASVFGASVALAINATATKFQTGAFNYFLGGLTYAKASTAGAGLTFTLAHVVSANKFGVILVQIDAAGTISTKVPSATQAYDTAAQARAVLPVADALNIAIGYIAIAAGAGAFTANTTNLTNGSGVVTATFVSATPQAAAAVASLVPIAGATVDSAAVPFLTGHGDQNGVIAVTVTTDGSGDVTDSFVTLRIRPFPLSGEVGRPPSVAVPFPT